MRTHSWLLALCLVPLFAGCGRKLTPLDTSQKERLKTALENSFSTVVEVSRQQNPAAALDANGSIRQMGQAMRDALGSGRCTASGNLKSAKWNPDKFEFPAQNWKIGGDRCPFQLSYEAGGNASRQSGELGFDFSWQVRDQDVRRLVDIGAITMKGKAEYRVSVTGVTAKASFDGRLDSLKEGDIHWYLTAEGSGTSRHFDTAELAFGLEFRDFTGELKIKKDGSRTEYYLNEEKVSPSDFQYFWK